jgi:hypothetical protein
MKEQISLSGGNERGAVLLSLKSAVKQIQFELTGEFILEPLPEIAYFTLLSETHCPLLAAQHISHIPKPSTIQKQLL